MDADKSERGAALVEMALVAPILLMLCLGIWSVARAYNVQNTLDHAAREAARYAATVEPWDPATTPGTVRAVADTALSSASISPSDVTVICIELVAAGGEGCVVDGTPVISDAPFEQVVVNLRYPRFRLEFIFFSRTIDMSAQSISRYEE